MYVYIYMYIYICICIYIYVCREYIYLSIYHIHAFTCLEDKIKWNDIHHTNHPKPLLVKSLVVIKQLSSFAGSGQTNHKNNEKTPWLNYPRGMKTHVFLCFLKNQSGMDPNERPGKNYGFSSFFLMFLVSTYWAA